MLRDQIRKLCLNVRRNQLQERMREILVIFSLVDVFHTVQLNPVRSPPLHAATIPYLLGLWGRVASLILLRKQMQSCSCYPEVT